MKRAVKTFCIFLFTVLCLGISSIAEEITLTTYYPAPLGTYAELLVDRNLTDNIAAITGLSIDIDESGTNAGTVTGLGVDVNGVASGTRYAATFQGGNVGIGTITPGANMHIYQGSPTANQILLQIGTSGDASRFTVDEDGDVSADGTVDATGYSAGGTSGASGTFLSQDGKTITVVNGIITRII